MAKERQHDKPCESLGGVDLMQGVFFQYLEKFL